MIKTTLPPLLDELGKRVILGDGAMATMLYQKGIFINQSYENLNLVRSHMVKNVHIENLRAGAELLQTNTFSANAFKLAKHGLSEKVHQINLAGVRLAREAAGGGAWIAGVVGPPGVEIEHDFEGTPRKELRRVYRQQLQSLLEGGLDVFFFESFSCMETLRLVVEEAEQLAPDVPRVALALMGVNRKTRFGATIEQAAKALNEMPADVVGMNDGPGPALLNELLGKLTCLTKKPIAHFPGAGLPLEHEDQLIDMATPEYFMELLRQAIHKGARLVGGSSGCHPEHIRAIKSSIKMLQPPRKGSQPAAVEAVVSGKKAVKMVEFDTPSRLQAKLRNGQFAVSVEIDPPVGTSSDRALAAAGECAESGMVDCINIADGPRATARMGPMHMAMLLKAQTPGVESIVHFCCRDRNILGMQADLIGANALGLHNILMITGDPPKLGDYPFATAVYDVDAIGALRIGRNLNSEKDLAGNPLKGGPTQLFLGCGANPGAIDLDLEVARLEEKVEAGANYILTQPVYDSELYFRFHERTRHLKVPLMLGILPLASFRNAEFLTKEVPGMHVPAPVRERLRKCEDKEAARQTGIEVAREALREALPTIQGTYIMPPFNRVDSALAVLEVARDRIEAGAPR